MFKYVACEEFTFHSGPLSVHMETTLSISICQTSVWGSVFSQEIFITEEKHDIMQNNNTCKHKCSVTNTSTVTNLTDEWLCIAELCLWVTPHDLKLHTSMSASPTEWLFHFNLISKPEEAHVRRRRWKSGCCCCFQTWLCPLWKGTTMRVTVWSLLCLCYNCKAPKRSDSFSLLTWLFSHCIHSHSHTHIYTHCTKLGHT